MCVYVSHLYLFICQDASHLPSAQTLPSITTSVISGTKGSRANASITPNVQESALEHLVPVCHTKI